MSQSSQSGGKSPAKLSLLQRANDEESDLTDALSSATDGNTDGDDPDCPSDVSNMAEAPDFGQEAPLLPTRVYTIYYLPAVAVTCTVAV